MADKKGAAEEAAEKPAATAEEGGRPVLPESNPVPATEPVSEPEAPEEPEPDETAMGPFMALANFLRNGVEVPAGKTITFVKDEAEHVRELLELGVLHSGTGKDAKAALEAAEGAREVARNTPPPTA